MTIRIVATLLATAALLGCANTKENLEERGIQVERGEVKRVFEF